MLESKNFLYLIRWINRIISIVIFFICVWIIISPFSPEITFAYKKYFSKNSALEIEKKLENNIQEQNNKISTTTEKKLELVGNTIYIPSIDLETEIKELKSIDDLHTGSWRRPETSTPDKGGNTVIVAHRYTRKNGESGPNTFYFLPKVQMGEKIFVNHENKMYEYEVYDIKIVEPEDTYIEDPTKENILTLYTCTPLWTSSQRHVVVAKLISPKI